MLIATHHHNGWYPRLEEDQENNKVKAQDNVGWYVKGQDMTPGPWKASVYHHNNGFSETSFCVLIIRFTIKVIYKAFWGKTAQRPVANCQSMEQIVCSILCWKHYFVYLCIPWIVLFFFGVGGCVEGESRWQTGQNQNNMYSNWVSQMSEMNIHRS